MDQIVQNIADALNSAFGDPRVVVLLLTMIPIAEARLSIPLGITAGLSAGEALGYAFISSLITAPILLLVLIPFINFLSRTKLFARVGNFLNDKFESKSKGLHGETQSATTRREKLGFTKFTKAELKKSAGVAAFVAIPVPLTGVWTGSAVASIVKLPFFKALISIILGNFVACSIITLLCYLLSDYISIITIVITIIAVLVVIALIVKFILYKPKKATEEGGETVSECAETTDGNNAVTLSQDELKEVNSNNTTQNEPLNKNDSPHLSGDSVINNKDNQQKK